MDIFPYIAEGVAQRGISQFQETGVFHISVRDSEGGADGLTGDECVQAGIQTLAKAVNVRYGKGCIVKYLVTKRTAKIEDQGEMLVFKCVAETQQYMWVWISGKMVRGADAIRSGLCETIKMRQVKLFQGLIIGNGLCQYAGYAITVNLAGWDKRFVEVFQQVLVVSDIERCVPGKTPVIYYIGADGEFKP